MTVFLGVKLATKGRVSLEDFERAVMAIPEVQVVQHVLGLFDYRLRVVARDIADFERVLRRRIMTLPGVGQVEANVLLTEERRPGPLGLADFQRFAETVLSAKSATCGCRFSRGFGGKCGLDCGKALQGVLR